MDTETLLALVSSLTTPPIPDSPVLLDALVQSNGDVEAAVVLINSNRTGRKRKLPVNLDGWLKPQTSKHHSGRGDHDVNDDGKAKTASTSILAGTRPQSRQSSPSKPVVNLMSVLQQPPAGQNNPRLPPLMLPTPALVAQHTPCTLHLSVLPPELACRLFHTMIDASKDWKRNKWWLFDRLVESPHRTSFFARKNDGVDDDDSWQEAAQYWYNGRTTEPPEVFPAAMEEACEIIERVVNSEMRKRKRFPLEWGGTAKQGQIWRANVAASNCYQGAKEGVGFHSDQVTYLGPYPTIASLSLGTRRVFSLREVVPADETNSHRARTFNIPLPHNSLTIMHASTQEKFKHSIPPQPAIDLFRPPYPPSPASPIEPSNCRINITFRFYRPDFKPAYTPRCTCGVPTILRTDMKNREDRYWWTCYAGAQNEGKGCGFWKVMDVEAEGRGPFVGSRRALSRS